MAVDFRLYLITDRALVPDLPAAVARALAGVPKGSAAVQLREKNLSARELLELALLLQPICRARDAPLLVNDRIDVALAADLDGVHLAGGSVDVPDARRLLGPQRAPGSFLSDPGSNPQASVPRARSILHRARSRRLVVGASCHDEAELVTREGADFATFGPVHFTPSKARYGTPVGLGALSSAAARGVPLFALGGVGVTEAPAAIAAGARGVATIRAWLAAPDPAEATAALYAAVNR